MQLEQKPAPQAPKPIWELEHESVALDYSIHFSLHTNSIHLPTTMIVILADRRSRGIVAACLDSPLGSWDQRLKLLMVGLEKSIHGALVVKADLFAGRLDAIRADFNTHVEPRILRELSFLASTN